MLKPQENKQTKNLLKKNKSWAVVREPNSDHEMEKRYDMYVYKVVVGVDLIN